jgi:hypothetical protein
MAKHTRRFIPRLEAFDERCLPSVTAVQSGDTLQILGDSKANVITIQDNVVIDSVTGEKGVIVTGDSQTWTFGSSVARIQVFTYGGSDTVNYNASGNRDLLRTVSIDMGANADTFNGNLDGLNVGAGVQMNVQVLGDGGGDHLNASAQNASVGASATLLIDLEGQKGKDFFSTNYSVAVDSTGSFQHFEGQ